MVGVARPITLDASLATDAPARAARLSTLAQEHFAYIWRLLRRLGLSDADADDAAQQAFLVASRRLDEIARGSERAFLYKAAVHTAYKHRRAQQRRREDELDELALQSPSDAGVEELIERHRAREILDAIVGTMSLDLRVVFVLYEIDGLRSGEIAEVLGIPLGTVASRLRRARADFELRVARFETQRKSKGEAP